MQIQNSKIKNQKFYIVILIFTFYILHFTSTPANAEVDISEKFGFGGIKTLGEGTSKLVTPAFSVSAVAVIIYFLFGALRYLKAGGNKEDIEGARQMIQHALIGFILLMFAFLVIQFLLSTLFRDTGLQLIQPQ